MQQCPGRVDDALKHRRCMLRRSIDKPRNDRLECGHPLSRAHPIEFGGDEIAQSIAPHENLVGRDGRIF